MTLRRPKLPKTRRLRTVSVLPSLVTLLNAACGFAAIHFAARGMHEPEGLLINKPEITFFAASAIMIYLGMVADALDGYVARVARSTSSFGGQLDSLSDMITFGVAPAFLALLVVADHLPQLGPISPVLSTLPAKLIWFTAAFYVCCAALRLARFNVENRRNISAHMGFSGLPTPAAAGVLASLVLLQNDYCRDLINGQHKHLVGKTEWLATGISHAAEVISQIIVYALPALMLAVAALMVSRIPYRHVVNRLVRGRRPFSHIVGIVLLALLLIWQFQVVTAIAFCWFAFGSAAHRLWQKYVKKIELPELAAEPSPQPERQPG